MGYRRYKTFPGLIANLVTEYKYPFNTSLHLTFSLKERHIEQSHHLAMATLDWYAPDGPICSGLGITDESGYISMMPANDPVEEGGEFYIVWPDGDRWVRNRKFILNKDYFNVKIKIFIQLRKERCDELVAKLIELNER